MSKAIRVRNHMTRSPHFLEVGSSLSDAHHLMREHGFRHLPVVDQGRLVGVISVHDLHLMETFEGVDPSSVPVEDAMSRDVFTVSLNAPLARTVREMAERKIGSAVVLEENDSIVGMLTTTDAMMALADLLEELS